MEEPVLEPTILDPVRDPGLESSADVIFEPVLESIAEFFPESSADEAFESIADPIPEALESMAEPMPEAAFESSVEPIPDALEPSLDPAPPSEDPIEEPTPEAALVSKAEPSPDALESNVEPTTEATVEPTVDLMLLAWESMEEPVEEVGPDTFLGSVFLTTSLASGAGEGVAVSAVSGFGSSGFASSGLVSSTAASGLAAVSKQMSFVKIIKSTKWAIVLCRRQDFQLKFICHKLTFCFFLLSSTAGTNYDRKCQGNYGH